MKKEMQRLCVLFLLLSLLLPLRAEADLLTIGVAPHTSARVILEMYQSLRQHLEQQLGMQVDIVTAADFNTFARRGLAQEFDLAVTTGQQARLLQTDAGYLPLVTYRAEFRSVALVAVNGPYRTLQSLKGATALGLSPTSQVTIWGQHWLQDNGLQGVAVRYVSASDSVAQLLVAGEAGVGFTSLANYQNLKPQLRSQLKIMAQSEPMAGRVYLLNKRRAPLAKKLEAALWSFAATPAGRQYFSRYKLEGYRPLHPGELASMDRYAAEVRTVLQKTR